jgi:2-C-methyl-D-erythritol 4-phosphate cytidylyltransferase
MNMPVQDKYWVIIPAAGTGNRMGTEIPKQYLKITGRTILEHTISRFIPLTNIEGIIVVISQNDSYWSNLELSRHEKVMTTIGGKARYHSVLNGLYRLSEVTGGNDWVLVHDAARPCIRMEDIIALIGEISNHADGGLLGIPARDTMKRADMNNEITGTISRVGLWHALTPQMFRNEALQHAIEKAIANNIELTDEAQAMEYAGFKPKFVTGHPDNIKITHLNDLRLAELFILQQEQH